MAIKIYPSITTIGDLGQTGIAATAKKIAEINKLKIKEACFFPTCLEPKRRRLVYRLLAKSCIKTIPLVHLRHDMTIKDLEFFVTNYNTQTFNIHLGKTAHPNQHNYGRYTNLIYVENLPGVSNFKMDDFLAYAGLCLDAAHLESQRLEKNPIYDFIINLLKKYPCGCGHISAVSRQRCFDELGNDQRYDHHFFKNFNEFNYLKRYRKLLPPIVALELENSITEQLKAKAYIKKLLKLT